METIKIKYHSDDIPKIEKIEKGDWIDLYAAETVSLKLFEHKYIYRDKKGKPQPFADKNKGLFELKETKNEKTGWVYVLIL